MCFGSVGPEAITNVVTAKLEGARGDEREAKDAAQQLDPATCELTASEILINTS